MIQFNHNSRFETFRKKVWNLLLQSAEYPLSEHYGMTMAIALLQK